MTRLLMAAAAFACTAVAARADWGGPSGSPVPPYPAAPGIGAPYYTAPPAEAAPGGGGGDRFGFNPIFRKMLWWKKDCDGCGKGCGKCGGCGTVPPPYGVYGNPAGMPGTLVFPNHQFNRSPRDYFMWER